MKKLAIVVIAMALLVHGVTLGQGDPNFATMQKAAEQGDIDAQWLLGYMYGVGMGVLKDEAKAVHWYRTAAEQGHTAAQFSLGLMYINGQGVPKDVREAAKLWKKAAEQGHTTAQFYLSLLNGADRGAPKAP